MNAGEYMVILREEALAESWELRRSLPDWQPDPAPRPPTYGFGLTCPYDGSAITPVTEGTTSGWETRAIGRCDTCGTRLLIAASVTAAGNVRTATLRRAGRDVGESHRTPPSPGTHMTDYRYTLTREIGSPPDAMFDDLHGRLCWVMLNPSTADDLTDDPTIRRVIRFTRDAGYESLEVVNLFAARAKNPRRLYEHDDPIGPENWAAILAAFDYADAVVFAWGSSGGPRAVSRANWVRGAARDLVRPPLCLGLTADGSPRHPLYVPASQPLVEYTL